MKTQQTVSEIFPEQTVGSIVRARPELARVFERIGIDYCCGGKRPLAQAFADARLDPATGMMLLQAMAAGPESGSEFDADALSLTALADHIERTHHAYVREELPRLLEMAERVARKHAERDARLPEVFLTLESLAAEMACHMEKEERILFPMVRQIEGGQGGLLPCGGLADAIGQMEAEHADAGAALARLRELTDNFRADDNACNTHRALLAGIADFERDMHRHVHKENNVLFPRAIELAGAASAN